MKKNIILVLICICFSVTLTTVLASNFTFLTDAPVSYFTNQDWDLYTAAQQKAVQTKDGVKTSWKNPDTGAWGFFIPSNTHNENGTTCRDLKVVNVAKQRSGESTYKICKTAQGWKAI